MPLHLRKRGRIWYIKGVVKVGKEKKTIEEFSTGLDSKQKAQEYLARLTTELQDELIHGPSGRAKHLTVGDMALAYAERPGRHHPTDLWRLEQLLEHIEDCAVADVLEGWQRFKKRRCEGLAPGTVDRFRTVLQAALNFGCAEHNLVAPKLPTIKYSNKRTRFLTIDEQERLVASYALHVQPIALTLCFQGCRTQEALQLDWRHVDVGRREIFFARTKNGEPRTVSMHKRVFEALSTLYIDRLTPIAGHVFLNRWGRPYADTREYRLPGGNPIAKAHGTACRRAGIEDFRVHDWRHHWACRAVMSGVDLPTIKRLGGWKDLESVSRYAAVSTDHMREAMRRME